MITRHCSSRKQGHNLEELPHPCRCDRYWQPLVSVHYFGLPTCSVMFCFISGLLPMIQMSFRTPRILILNAGLMKRVSCAMICGSLLMALAAGELHELSSIGYVSPENTRVCLGQHVANRSAFINTAFILWAFRLSENPAAKIDTLGVTDTANMHALPFEISFEKRVDEKVMRELLAPGE
jgi:hypothetical protein